jgi:hypothetical protein
MPCRRSILHSRLSMRLTVSLTHAES